ncbi:D-3-PHOSPHOGLYCERATE DEHYDROGENASE 2 CHLOROPLASTIC [Salix koriyanagi]|uniref:D-3-PHOSPHOGLYCERATE DEHYDROGENASE 2 CHLOROPLASTIC n=1 Tax=Salix koriyanagi TaxID=2511006 RepID=A0A9Q0YSZ0_9ROSI|nr:D-3-PHOSPHOGLYCERATE DEHYDROGENASE 2 CHLOROPLASTIC [Salix koriyanagi]
MGFGKVGSEVARRAKGLGMHVIAHDPYAPADRARAIGVGLLTFEEAISIADFISLRVIDEEALVRALDSGIVCSGSCFLHHVLIALILAEAVVGALKGELAATAVNTPMVPAEVRKTWQTGSATGWRWRWCTVNKDDLCFCQRSR